MPLVRDRGQSFNTLPCDAGRWVGRLVPRAPPSPALRQLNLDRALPLPKNNKEGPLGRVVDVNGAHPEPGFGSPTGFGRQMSLRFSCPRDRTVIS